MGLYLNSESGNLYCRLTFRNESGHSNSVYLLNSRATPSFPSVEPLPFLSLSADRPINEYVWHQLLNLYASPFHPPIISSGPFQAKNTGLGDLYFQLAKGRLGAGKNTKLARGAILTWSRWWGSCLLTYTKRRKVYILVLSAAMGSNLREILENICYPEIFLSFQKNVVMLPWTVD